MLTAIQYIDASIFQQLRKGLQANRELYGIQPVAVSPVKNALLKELPHVLTVAEIKEIEQQFADCAVNAKKAGFDGIEIHGVQYFVTIAGTTIRFLRVRPLIVIGSKTFFNIVSPFYIIIKYC